MAISYDLLSEFARLVNKDKKSAAESTVYGTIVEDGEGNKYVKLDGSDQLTPLNDNERPAADSTTVNANVGERVSVLIKNHTATVTGNVSSPAARTGDVENLGDQVLEIQKFDIAIGERVEANEGYIKELQADHIDVGEIKAAVGDISKLNADEAIIDKLIAAEGDIESIKSTQINTELLDAKYATIDQLKLNKGEVFDLKARDLEVTNKLEANEADIEELHTTIFDAESGEIKFANIDFANIGTAAIEKFFSKSGMIKDLVVGDHTVTGQFVGVTIDAGSISTGQLIADRIVVKGDDGIYYKLNVEAGVVASAEVSEEQLQNGLHGDTIIAHTITAEKVDVKDLVAFGATIGGFHITEDSLYSGAKSAVNNTTRGIYLDKDGQFNVGDSSNFLKFFKDTDGTYKLAIQAQKITFGAGKKDVETAIGEVNTAANTAQSTANKAQTTANGAQTTANNANTAASNAQTAATNAQQTADAVQTNLNNLKIGGRNLLTNTHFPLNNNRYDHIDKIGEGGFMFTHNDYQQYDSTGVLTTIIPKDTECIVSAKIRGNASLVIYNISESGNRPVSFVSPDKLSETEFTRFTLSYTTHADVYAVYLYTRYRSENYTEWFEVEPNSLKLEFGNKATDWTPAPEDVDASISNAQAAADEAQAKANANAEDLTKYIASTNAALDSMQDQIDGSITTWFYGVAPTTSNAPAKDWTTTDLKNNHLGDLYYNTVTGYCYRWQVVNNIYSWQLVKDTDVTKALEDAASAKDTADKKRQVFTATPTPPYDVGDLWVQGTNGDIMRCQTSKNKGQAYAASDWIKASKYTDDTVAKNAQSTANSAQTAASNAQSTANTAQSTANTAQSTANTAQTTASNAQSTANKAQADIDGLEIGARNLLVNSEKTVGEDAVKEFVQFADIAPIFDTYGLIEYTISFDIKSADTTNNNAVQVYCQNGSGSRHNFNEYVTVTTEWQRLHVTVTPVMNDESLTESKLAFYGTYDTGNIPIVRNVKIEKGNRATDWTPAPEDVKTDIDSAQTTATNAQQTADEANAIANEAVFNIDGLANQIASLVRGENGETLMTQTDDGWIFDISKIISKLESTSEAASASAADISELQNGLSSIESDVSNIGKVTAHISATSNESGQPQLELSASNNSFRVVITNTSINFMDGSDCPAYISNKRLNIDQAQIDESLSFPTPSDSVKPGEWIWKTRSNGNYGLTWKELT
jgi:hypothetical protein